MRLQERRWLGIFVDDYKNLNGIRISTPSMDALVLGLAPRQGCDGWRVVDDDYGQAVGKLQAKSMMSTVASLFPQLETKVCRSGEEQTND
jgi:hypothetical protein